MKQGHEQRIAEVPHEPLVVESDPDGENVEEKDQAYSADSPTEEGHWACHPELLLTSRQQLDDCNKCTKYSRRSRLEFSHVACAAVRSSDV